MVASVNASQPLPACELGVASRTVSTALSSSTPCSAQPVRLPLLDTGTPRSSASSL